MDTFESAALLRKEGIEKSELILCAVTSIELENDDSGTALFLS